jgi:hypothetical protein
MRDLRDFRQRVNDGNCSYMTTSGARDKALVAIDTRGDGLVPIHLIQGALFRPILGGRSVLTAQFLCYVALEGLIVRRFRLYSF